MDERKMIYLDDAIDAICKHGTALERRGILVLALVEHKQMTIDLLESLPSAQPEIVRCKDCKHYKKHYTFGREIGYCERGTRYDPRMSIYMPEDGFCSFGERGG